jgi:hypothetical protein
MYNVDSFGWDPNQVKLIKAQAMLDYQQYVADKKAQNKAFWQGELAVTGIAIVMILFVFLCLNVLMANAEEKPRSITETIAYVRANIRDVNLDGKINCIDYAVMFYEYYPDSEIIHCKNNRYGFNHLLNRVNGRYIEPQTASGDPMVLWYKEWPDATKEEKTVYWAWWATDRHW